MYQHVEILTNRRQREKEMGKGEGKRETERERERERECVCVCRVGESIHYRLKTKVRKPPAESQVSINVEKTESK